MICSRFFVDFSRIFSQKINLSIICS